MKKIAIIHTTPVTIPVLKIAIEKKCEEYEEKIEIINLLDDSVLPEINKTGKITEGVQYRLGTLLIMAQSIGADAVLCACSSIGGAIEKAAELITVPVLRIDEPMAKKAAEHSRIGIAATLESTVVPTRVLIERKIKEINHKAEIESFVIEGAGKLLAEGRGEDYDNLVGKTLEEMLEKNEIVVLAQASMARAVEKWPQEKKCRCLTSVESGVEALVDFLKRQ